VHSIRLDAPRLEVILSGLLNPTIAPCSTWQRMELKQWERLTVR
jgi:hypothetical protein